MIFKGFALGVSTGAFCLGFCAPVLMGLMFSKNDEGLLRNAKSLGLFLLGRLIAYILFGFISFGLGEIFRGTQVFAAALPIGEILLGGLMIIYCVKLSFPHFSLCSSSLTWVEGRWALFLAGFFTGINLCPPFILAVGTAMNSGSLLKSILFFLAFFSATSLFLLPFIFSGFASRSAYIQKGARFVCGLTGLWLSAEGVLRLRLLY